MKMRSITALVGLALASPAAAQQSIDWFTIDSGGGLSEGGGFTLVGTIGQFDAGVTMSGGGFELRGGFWVVLPSSCTADFNADGDVNSQDFFDFLTAFFGADPRADINDDDVINSQDFFDFLSAFFTGCA